MKLYYSCNLNPRVAVAVARYLDSPVEFVRASPRAPGQKDKYLPLNPNALVPILDEEGSVLWETDAIACRLSQIAGRSDFWLEGPKAPDLQRWISWSGQHFTRVASVYYWEFVVKPAIGMGAPDLKAIAAAEPEFHALARILDDCLLGRQWLIGESLCYADFRVATPLPFAADAKLPLDDYRNLQAWNDRLNTLAAWSQPFAGLE
jgi:glutathione S-transferase